MLRYICSLTRHTHVQELYGPPAVVAPSPAPKPRTPSNDREKMDPALCADSSVDAMVTLEIGGRKNTYAFKGAQYWRLTDTGVEEEYPKLIRDSWEGVPDNLDAILPYEESNRIYFFKVSYRLQGHGIRWISRVLREITHR